MKNYYKVYKNLKMIKKNENKWHAKYFKKNETHPNVLSDTTD